MRTVTYLKKIVTLTLSLFFILQSTAFGAYSFTEITKATPYFLKNFWGAATMSANGESIFLSNNSSSYGYYGYKTTNEGLAWDRINLTTNIRKAVSSSDNAIILGLTNGDEPGLRKSVDGGQNWSSLTNAPLNSGLYRGISISSDGTKMAATYGAGVSNGIYVSTNSGSTWTMTQGAIGGRNFQEITSSSDGTKLYTAYGIATTAYIYSSTDSGTTWSHISSVNVSTPFYFEGYMSSDTGNLFVSSSDGTKLAFSGSYGSIYVSTNSGTSWTQSTGGPDGGPSSQIRSTAMSSDGTKLITTGGGYIYTSTDEGLTWTQRTSAGQRAWRSVDISSDGTKLIAVDSNNGLYMSLDGGVTWSLKLSQKEWSAIASSSDGTKLAATNLYGYIYTSTDSGSTWVERTNGGPRGVPPSPKVQSIASSSDGTKLAAVYGDISGYVYTSSDQGATWIERISSGLLTRSGPLMMSHDGTKILSSYNIGGFGSGYGLSFSVDSGSTWLNKVTGYGSQLSASSDFSTLIATDRSYGVFGYGHKLYKSVDMGDSWSELRQFGGNISIDISPGGTKIVAAKAYGYVYTSDDGGSTWVERTSGPLGTQSPFAPLFKSFLSSDGNKIVVFKANSDSSVSIYTSNDFGETWSNQVVSSSANISTLNEFFSRSADLSVIYNITQQPINRDTSIIVKLSSLTTPSQVTSLSATTSSSTQINLSWTAPANGGSAITGYLIERESPTGNGFTTLVANTGNTNTTYSDTGLSPATQYNYRVSAINAIGTGTASTGSVATTDPAPVPPTPAPTTRTPIPLAVLRTISAQTQPPTSPAPTVTPPPATPPFTIRQRLTPAQNRSEIQRLQQFLNTNGFTVSSTGAGSPGRETTTFGPATRRALQRFQRANGISPTGTFGPQTRARINILLKENIQQPR